MDVTTISQAAVEASGSDPITAFMTRDWAAAGGWSLLIATWIAILMGAVLEKWVPGARYRRLEESSIKLANANDELLKQNGQLITGNEITKHFFQETIPKRGEQLT